MPLDIFDEIELSGYDKLILSGEFRDFKKDLMEQIKSDIKEGLDELKKELTSKFSEDSKTSGEKSAKDDKEKTLLMKAFVSGNSEVVRKELKAEIADLKKDVDPKVEPKLRATIKEAVATIKAELEDAITKMRNRYDDLRNQMLLQPRYEFGGFSPQANDLNIGDPSIEGAWRIVKSGNNLSFQRYESGVWVEKGAMTAQ